MRMQRQHAVARRRGTHRLLWAAGQLTRVRVLSFGFGALRAGRRQVDPGHGGVGARSAIERGDGNDGRAV